MASPAAITNKNTIGGTSQKTGSPVSNKESQRKSNLYASKQKSFIDKKLTGLFQAADQSGKKINSEASSLNPEKINSEVNRRRNLSKAQHQARVGQPLTLPQTKSKSTAKEKPQGTIKSARSKIKGIRAKIAKAKKDQSVLSSEIGAEKAKKQTRKMVKKAAKNTMQRGAIYATDLIASALDLGTSGVALVVDIFVYIFTLGWLNVELFYGRLLREDKDPFISALSYDPIPMPVDPKANFLAGVVLAADAALVLAVIIMLSFNLVLIMVWVAPLLIPGLIIMNPDGFLSAMATMFAL